MTPITVAPALANLAISPVAVTGLGQTVVLDVTAPVLLVATTLMLFGLLLVQALRRPRRVATRTVHRSAPARLDFAA